MSINYTVVDSCLGRLLVAATSRGVCSVAMGNSDRDLERALTDEYPAASIARDDGALARWTRAIVAHLDGVRRDSICRSMCRPLLSNGRLEGARRDPERRDQDVCEVAEAVDGRARASGWACVCCKQGRDSIPCHRVVPTIGGTGNYRWGAEESAAGAGAPHQLIARIEVECRSHDEARLIAVVEAFPKARVPSCARLRAPADLGRDRGRRADRMRDGVCSRRTASTSLVEADQVGRGSTGLATGWIGGIPASLSVRSRRRSAGGGQRRFRSATRGP